MRLFMVTFVLYLLREFLIQLSIGGLPKSELGPEWVSNEPVQS